MDLTHWVVHGTTYREAIGKNFRPSEASGPPVHSEGTVRDGEQ